MKRLLAILALAALWASSARAETIVTTLSTDQVFITSTYTGAQIALFGVIQLDPGASPRRAPYDLVVTVRGPRRTTIVREKARAGPIWINRTQRRFIDLPAFLTVLATRPVEEIATSATRQEHKIGIDAILTPVGLDMDLDTAEVRFREALLRLKTADGLFAENARGVTFLTGNVFRAPISLPATAPTGTYDVEIALFVAGALIRRETTSFEVDKTGFEQVMVSAARDRSLLYGVVVAAFSVLFGWVASVVFRRD